MALEKTLVLLKPCTLQRGLVGEIVSVFEKKGLQICGMKMMQLDDKLLSEHYAHLSEKPFFQRVKDAMMTAPVVAMCLKGVDAIAAVELNRFFRPEEILEWNQSVFTSLYACDEY